MSRYMVFIRYIVESMGISPKQYYIVGNHDRLISCPLCIDHAFLNSVAMSPVCCCEFVQCTHCYKKLILLCYDCNEEHQMSKTLTNLQL
jgi:hypothetical protein